MSDDPGPKDSGRPAGGSWLRSVHATLPPWIGAIAAVPAAVVAVVVLLGLLGGDSGSPDHEATSPPSIADSSGPPAEGTMAVKDRDYVNLTGGYVRSSWDARANFRVISDLDVGVIRLLGEAQRSTFALIDAEIAKQSCDETLRSRRDTTYELTSEWVGQWICVQTSDDRVGAVRIDRVDLVEGSLDLTYVVWQ